MILAAAKNAPVNWELVIGVLCLLIALIAFIVFLSKLDEIREASRRRKGSVKRKARRKGRHEERDK